jgi:hypothetical protein
VVTLWAAGGDTALTCTTDLQGACTDTTHTAVIPASSQVALRVTNPNAASLGVLVGMEASS